MIATRESKEQPLFAEVQVLRVDPRTVRVAWSGGATATLAHLGRERTTLTIGAAGGSALVSADGLEGGTFEVSVSSGLETARFEVAP